MQAGKFDMAKMEIVREPLGYEETDEQYHKRQEQAIYELVTTQLFIVKDDSFVTIMLIPKMAKLLADLFYGRLDKLILWANRGGGKSLLAAIFMWISFVYKKKSCINMGGAGNQAKRVYDYTKQFWHNFPGMQEGMLTREPLLQSTEMKNGSKLVCATSMTTAIGEHMGCFVADEACTDRPGADQDLMRAMQGALSEPDHTIFLLSTFHLPTGFFADCWDNADRLGFTRMKWDCFDTMKACSVGMDRATEKDPLAVEAFCKKECPLCWEIDTRDEFGNVTGQKWVGCLGKARKAQGWQGRDTVLEEQNINIGTRIFPVEHCCIRPEGEGQIYNRALIDACVVDSFNLCVNEPLTVGIDWGLTQCAVVLVGVWSEEDPEDEGFPLEGLGVVDIVFMSNRLVEAVVEQLRSWQLRFQTDRLTVRADASHPYCNKELASFGYIVRAVKGDRQLMGEDNVARWLGSGNLKILSGFTFFIQQLHNLRRNILTGKQKKINTDDEQGDHGPDALKFALMNYDYIRWVEKRRKAHARHVETKQRRPPQGKPPRRGFDTLLYQ